MQPYAAHFPIIINSIQFTFICIARFTIRVVLKHVSTLQE